MHKGFIVGTCREMCPKKEMQMRERERLLHILETDEGSTNSKYPKADQAKTVKSFSRSAAGQRTQTAADLRPPDVLLKTIKYLLGHVIMEKKVPFTSIYDFIMDRLRAVRQDMVIQNISERHSIELLEPIVKFYAYSSYRLCEESIEHFDPNINKQHLQECLKRLLVCYDSIEYLKNSEMGKITKNRSYFEALYIIFNLNSNEALLRAISLAPCWKDFQVKNALRVSLYNTKSNWVVTCNFIERLPPILAAVAASHLPSIRRKTIQVLSTAYNSKRLSFPTKLLETWLLYSDTHQVVKDLKYYTLKADGNEVFFIKEDFDEKKQTPQPHNEKFVDSKLTDNIPSLLLD